MRVCAANSERKRIQNFDNQFKQRSSSRFKIPSTKKCQSPSLCINQEVVTDPKTILAAWENLFRVISSSNTEQPPAVCSSEDEDNTMMCNSLNNENSLLDIPFASEEVDSALKKLKLGKAAGHDGVQAKHLKYGGPILRDWILQICNATAELECVPDSLKTGIITPVYKGGGKDPLNTNSYRGVTLTSVLAKVLESLILARLQCHLSGKGIPHLNQTAYCKGVFCAEAIFSTLEVLSVYSQHCEKLYMCFYDLQNAFDSVQYPVLLKRLYEAGVDGRAWRLLELVHKEHGEGGWLLIFHVHARARSSPRLCPLPSSLPADYPSPYKVRGWVHLLVAHTLGHLSMLLYKSKLTPYTLLQWTMD